MLAETQGANVTLYVHAPRGIHAQKDVSGNWEWMVNDGLSSVREVVDNNLNVLWSNSFDPYGTGFGAVGTSQTGYGFTGEPTDGIGLIHLRPRDYSPALGVFPSLDPFEGVRDRVMSLNGYSWVEGNVPNMVDPSGERSSLIGAICGLPSYVGSHLPFTDPCIMNCALYSRNTEQFESCADECERQSLFELNFAMFRSNLVESSVTYAIIGQTGGCTTWDGVWRDMRSKSGSCIRESLSIGNIVPSGILTHSHFDGANPSFELSMAALKKYKWLYIDGNAHTDIIPISDIRFSPVYTIQVVAAETMLGGTNFMVDTLLKIVWK